MKISRSAVVSFLAVASIASSNRDGSACLAFTPTTKSFFGLSSATRAPSNSALLSTTNRKDTDEELFTALHKWGLSSSQPQQQQQQQDEQQAQPTHKQAPLVPTTSTVQQASRQYLQRYAGQSGASIVYSKLQEHGVTVVNGYSGGAVLPLLDQFHELNPRHASSHKQPIRWITNSNEASAGHIAEGYAKSMPMADQNGNLPVSVVVATSGPGVTNLITPLQDAYCDGVPIVVLCGQAATNAPQDAFQSAPAVAMTAPCTKWSYQIKNAAEIPHVMDYAFFMARNGRPGPVFVDLPKDLQNQILNDDLLNNYVDLDLVSTDDHFTGVARIEELTNSKRAALRIGNQGGAYPSEGLLFDVDLDLNLCLADTTAEQTVSGIHADHGPTDTIFHRTVSTEGELEPIVRQGQLTSDPLASNRVMDSLVDMIQRAKKPIILAGQGASDSPQELKQFAEALQIPVTTTLHALGVFDERHPLALNMVGMHGHPTPNFMIQEADLVINVGSRFDDRITGRMSDFVPAAKKAAELGVGGIIHVDIRKSEQDKQVEPTFFVHAKAKSFLTKINKTLKTRAPILPRTSSWLSKKAQLERDFPITIPTYQPESISKDGITASRTLMSAQLVVSELDRQLLKADKMDDAIFTTGVGIHQMVAAQLITWTQPRQMLSSGSLGTMGVALGYSIGAKLANPKKLVIAVDGDGSFNMTFTELKTVAEQCIPVKIMILDNESQMMVEYWQRLFHDARYLAVRNSINPDYVQLAKAFGGDKIRTVYCDSADKLEESMRSFLFDAPDQPALFHVKITRTPCLPLVAPGQPLDDMILEDVQDQQVDPNAAPS